MYLIALVVGLGCFALIDRRWGLFFWSGRPWRAALVLAVGVAFFLAWDLVGIAHGLFWHGENSLTLGVFVAAELPLEEVFFLAFLSYQTMIYVLGVQRWWQHRTAGSGAAGSGAAGSAAVGSVAAGPGRPVETGIDGGSPREGREAGQ